MLSSILPNMVPECLEEMEKNWYFFARAARQIGKSGQLSGSSYWCDLIQLLHNDSTLE